MKNQVTSTDKGILRTLWAVGLVLSLIWSYPSQAQTAGDDQTDSNVEAATNPAGQVPDGIPVDDGSSAHGRSLFGQHCTACHAIGKQIIGPALASAHNRRPLDWLVSFIQNSQEVIRTDSSGYAEQLFIQYNRQVMPNFEFLSREDILDILAYIKIESVSTTSGVSGYMSDETEARQQDGSAGDNVYAQKDGEASSNDNLLLIVGGIVVGLLLVNIILITLRRKTKQEA